MLKSLKQLFGGECEQQSLRLRFIWEKSDRLWVGGPSGSQFASAGQCCIQNVHISKRYKADYSEDKNRVVAVHCNHGKGRTGTAIISFFLLIGYS